MMGKQFKAEGKNIKLILFHLVQSVSVQQYLGQLWSSWLKHLKEKKKLFWKTKTLELAQKEKVNSG